MLSSLSDLKSDDGSLCVLSSYFTGLPNSGSPLRGLQFQVHAAARVQLIPAMLPGAGGAAGVLSLIDANVLLGRVASFLG